MTDPIPAPIQLEGPLRPLFVLLLFFFRQQKLLFQAGIFISENRFCEIAVLQSLSRKLMRKIKADRLGLGGCQRCLVHLVGQISLVEKVYHHTQLRGPLKEYQVTLGPEAP